MCSRFYKSLAIFFLAGSLQAVSLFAATLPPACGNDKVQFDVKLKNSRPPAAPAPGMAQIVFIEYLNDPNGLADSPIVRFAMDGSWVGATKADASVGESQKFSYFAISVSPGEHHICSDWLSQSDGIRGEVGLDTLTAEAGKVYYYQLRLSIRPY